jgi:hypothetical protein
MIEHPQVSFNYSLSYRDFVAGQKLAAQKSVFLFVIHAVMRFIAPLAASILIAMCLINYFGGHQSLVRPILPTIFWLLFLSSILTVGWRFSFNQLRPSGGRNPQMTFQADETSFVREIHGMGDMTWLWSATHGISSNKRTVLISVRRGAYLYIPRCAVTDEQLEMLKEFWRKNRKI